jgi:hypothetical protein
VIVTATLDNNSLQTGQATKLRVWGQVAPDIADQSDRIFSWYIDGLNSAPAAASPQWDQLLMPGCDSPTGTTASSSTGVSQGAARVGIRNTFLTKPAAGKLAPVQLFEVDVRATSAGQTVFSVRAGTGTPNIAYDFQVARAGGGEAFTGGLYTSASVTLTVTGDSDDDQDGLTNSEEATLGSNPALADTDRDGLTDLEEYGYGSSLVSPSSAFRPLSKTAILTVGGVTAEYQELVVRRSLTAQRVAISVQSSSDLATWPANAVMVSSQSNGDGTVTETWRAPQAVSSTSRVFLRANVVRNG